MINLTKNESVVLTKESKKREFSLGLAWDLATLGNPADLDASAFLLTKEGKVRSSSDLVYFGNLSHVSGAVTHTGDNLTGKGDGWDEIIKVDLDKVPSDIERILFVANIYQARSRRQNFGQIKNACIGIMEKGFFGEKEIIRHNLSGDFSLDTGVKFGELVRQGNEWNFVALSQGSDSEIGDYCKEFGVN